MTTPMREAQDLAREMVRGSIIEDATARFLAQCFEYVHADRIAPLREYLLETSGRLHQLATDTNGLSPSDMRRLANDMARVANRENTTEGR